MVAHKCSLLLRTSVSVADENKVGIAPEGSLRRVVELLHPALGPALRGASPTSPRHPVTLIKPSLFAEIRAVLHIPDAAFHASMALQQGRFQSDMRTIPVAQAAGKSRAFFFLSPDQHYIFKSAGNADLETLYRIAPQYIEHFKTHANSLLPRYVAVIELRMEVREALAGFVVLNLDVTLRNCPPACGKPAIFPNASLPLVFAVCTLASLSLPPPCLCSLLYFMCLLLSACASCLLIRVPAPLS